MHGTNSLVNRHLGNANAAEINRYDLQVMRAARRMGCAKRNGPCIASAPRVRRSLIQRKVTCLALSDDDLVGIARGAQKSRPLAPHSVPLTMGRLGGCPPI